MRKRARNEIQGKNQPNEGPSSGSNSECKAKKVSANKIAKPARPEEYPPRVQLDWKVGAHVSSAGGVENAILNAASIGANAFALFVKSQRKWFSAPMESNSIDLFKSRLLEFNYLPDLVLPHGSYLINLGNPDIDKRTKSYLCFLEDLKRCEQLGLTRYNFHPGSTVGNATKDESIAHIAACLNRAHKETSAIVTVIENMAGSGNTLGAKFEEIAQIIDRVEDKSRVGVCLDTCHMFAAGYDIRSEDAYEATMSEFDRIVGLHYLKGMHLNDSKTTLGSHKDRHDNIGRGHISLPIFGYIMRDIRLQHIPLILETPTNEDSSVWAKEIEVLRDICSRSTEDYETIQRLANSIREVVDRSTGGKTRAGKRARTKNPAKGEKRKREDNTDNEVIDEVTSVI